MSEVPVSGSPHQRKLKEEKLEEEVDLVDKLLQKSGCEEQHYKVQECMVEFQDWRKCQAVLKEFQFCITKSQQNKQPRPA